MKKYTEEQQILQRVKKQLLKHLYVSGMGRYTITLDQEDWHRIFKTRELNKCGITYDDDYE